jgi:hypothetical protein
MEPNMEPKACVLYDRLCVDCGECDWCDLDPDKRCDNCKKCLGEPKDYRAIRIDGLLTDEEKLEGEA